MKKAKIAPYLVLFSLILAGLTAAFQKPAQASWYEPEPSTESQTTQTSSEPSKSTSKVEPEPSTESQTTQTFNKPSESEIPFWTEEFDPEVCMACGMG